MRISHIKSINSAVIRMFSVQIDWLSMTSLSFVLRTIKIFITTRVCYRRSRIYILYNFVQLARLPDSVTYGLRFFNTWYSNYVIFHTTMTSEKLTALHGHLSIPSLRSHAVPRGKNPRDCGLLLKNCWTLNRIIRIQQIIGYCLCSVWRRSLKALNC